MTLQGHWEQRKRREKGMNEEEVYLLMREIESGRAEPIKVFESRVKADWFIQTAHWSTMSLDKYYIQEIRLVKGFDEEESGAK
jgi:hypothetical protein